MAKAWTNIALVESDIARKVSFEDLTFPRWLKLSVMRVRKDSGLHPAGSALQRG
jgi:hypothetical protein